MASRSLDGVLIKKANQREQWGEDRISEMAKCLDPKTGYLYFIRNYFYIQHPVKGKIKFEPYDYQLGLLEAYHKYRQVCVLQSRQNGKCVEKQALIKIKHKKTGEEREISVGELFDMQKTQIG